MLDASDQQRLREIEAHLLADDPRFVARMRGEDTDHTGILYTLAALWTIWAATLLAVAPLGWPVLAIDGGTLAILGGITWWAVRGRRHRAWVVG